MTKVILFGAGNMLKQTLSFLKENIKVVAILDNDVSKQNKKYRGIPIWEPAKLTEIAFDYIIISNEKYSDEIVLQIIDLGIDSRYILPIYSLNINDKDIIKRISSVVKKKSFLELIARQMLKNQVFFPNLLGIVTNPYYFSRRGIWKALDENKEYISGKCLDFGCGIKPYESLFNVEEYIGVEIEGGSNRNDIVYYDGHKLPFQNETFDSILCSEVFEHIPNLDEIVIELKRVLKKGGYMVITVPFAYPEHCKPYDFRRFTSYGIKSLLEEHNLQVVKQEKIGTFINAISQMKGVFINEKLSTSVVKKYLRYGLICLNNVGGIVTNKLLPKDSDLYLDNLVILKK